MRPAGPLATATLLALGAGLVALVFAGTLAGTPGQYGFLWDTQEIYWGKCIVAAGALYLAAVAIVRARAIPAWTTAAILALGLAARLLVLVNPPQLSTDIYRYVWDGRVLVAGINPYRYVPADPALAFLRDHGTRDPTAIAPNINRSETAHTIYPPAAQALFALTGLTWSSIWAIKGLMLAFDALTAAAALLLLRAAARPAALVVVWAWCPLVVWEFAGGGHIDVAAVAMGALAMLAAARRRTAWAGIALAAAVLFKLLPAALFPALWRRGDWRTPAVAAIVIVAAYIPYISVGAGIFGFLSGYIDEEGLATGGGVPLLKALSRLLGPLPHWSGTAYHAAGALLLAAATAAVALRRPFPATLPDRTRRIARDALLLTAALFAVIWPHYPWYYAALVLPAVLLPAWSVLWVVVTAPLTYLELGQDDLVWPAVMILPALLLIPVDLYLIRRATFPALLAEGRA